VKAFIESAAAFKLVWFRVLMYFLIPALSTFLTLTETWSGETWDSTHVFLRWRLLVGCVVPGMSAIVGYIDASFQKAKEELKAKKEVITTT